MAKGSFIARASHRHLAKGAAAYGIARGTSSVLALVVLAILSRSLSALDFGVWVLLVSAFQLVASSDFGFTAGVRIRIIKLLSRGREKMAVRTFLLSSGVLGAVCGLLGMAAICAFDIASLLALPDTLAMRIAGWVTIELALLSLPAGIAANLFFSYMESATVAVLEVARSVMQSAVVAVLAFAGAPLLVLVICYYGVYFLCCVLGLAIFARRRGIGWHSLRLVRGLNLRHQPRWFGVLLSRSLLLFISAAAYSFIMNSGALAISHALSVESVGDYSVLVRIMSAALAISAALLAAYSGGYGVHFHNGNYGWVRRSLLLFSGITVACWLLGSAVFLVAGPGLVHAWFGRVITDMNLYTAVAVWALVLALYQVFWGFLQSAGQMWLQAVSGLVVAAGNFALALFWVPRYGAAGAVWASSAMTGLWLLLAMGETVRLVGFAGGRR